MVDFVSEVQEELRKDDYNRWLKKYGPFLFGLIVAIILGAAYLEWKKSSDAKVAEKMSLAYQQASEQAATNADGAIAEFTALSKTAPTGYAGLSLVRAAQLELDKGNILAAVTLLDQANATFESPRHKQLAQMKIAYILAGQGDYENVITRMTPLIEKGQPYEYLARELLGFAANETGDLTTARKHFSYLETIPGVPDSIQARAKQNLMLMSKAVAPTAPAETPQTPAEDDTNE